MKATELLISFGSATSIRNKSVKFFNTRFNLFIPVRFDNNVQTTEIWHYCTSTNYIFYQQIITLISSTLYESKTNRMITKRQHYQLVSGNYEKTTQLLLVPWSILVSGTIINIILGNKKLWINRYYLYFSDRNSVTILHQAELSVQCKPTVLLVSLDNESASVSVPSCHGNKPRLYPMNLTSVFMIQRRLFD